MSKSTMDGSSSKRRTLDWILLMSLLAGIFLSLWFPDRIEAKCLLVVVLLAQCLDAWRSREANRKLFESHAADLPERNEYVRLGVFTLVGGVLLFLICLATGAFRGEFFAAMLDKSASEWVTVKLPTVIGQQIVLQLLLAPVLLRLFKRVSVAVAVGAGIFSMFHLPNLLLVALTVAAGSIWLASYYRARRLKPIILSHAVLAIFTAGFCGEYALNMRVGASCVAMLPSQIETETGYRVEFPRCVIGCAERLSQSGSYLIVEGWAYDSVHHRCPSSLFAKVGGKLIEIDNVEFERTPSDHWRNSKKGGFVDDHCYSFTARIPISSTQVSYFDRNDTGAQRAVPTEFELYASNVNGRVAQLGKMGELKAIETAASIRTVVLFPVEVDGRIDWVDWNQQQIRLRGWAADMKSTCLAEKICIECDGQLSFVDLDEFRLRRPATAKSLDQPLFIDCGFEIPAEKLSIYALDKIRCYAVDRQQQLHPISLTTRAEERIANRLQDGDTIIR